MVKKSSKSKKNQPKAKISFLEIGIIALIVAAAGLGTYFVISNLKTTDYIIETNAFFAPFEYYEGTDIKGVDVEIVNQVAVEMGKTIAIKDVEFDVIIDNVSAGKIADAGAAGLTITEPRKEKVDFTIPYYTSVQYVIYNKSDSPSLRNGHIVWNELAGKTLGSQTGGTGYLFAESEIEEGVLAGTNAEIKGFDNHQLAADAIASGILDYAIADELVAQMIVSKNSDLLAVPLYYMGSTIEEDYPAEESYAVAVNKEKPELLEAFNKVLTRLCEKDADGESEIDRLVLKYMGF